MSNATPEIEDWDWLDEAVGRKTKSNQTAHERRARDDESQRALNPEDPDPITRERDAQPLADLLGVPVEEIAHSLPTADEIVARQEALSAQLVEPPMNATASPTTREPVSPELAEIRMVRAELRDLTALVIAVSQRLGKGKGGH